MYGYSPGAIQLLMQEVCRGLSVNRSLADMKTRWSPASVSPVSRYTVTNTVRFVSSLLLSLLMASCGDIIHQLAFFFCCEYSLYAVELFIATFLVTINMPLGVVS
jgi:hypothetical protein